MNHLKRFLGRLPHPIRWILTIVIGVALIVLGLIMLVTPGPGIVFLFLGISVLAFEIEWARELNKQGVQGLEILLKRLKTIFSKKPKH